MSSMMRGTERHVRSGKHRQPDDVHVFLQCGSDDLFGSLTQAGIDDLETGIAKSAGNDFRAAIVSVETGLGNKHADSFRHQKAGSS